MDPISALSVAAAVVQFVDFAGTLLSSTRTIHKAFSKEAESVSDLRTITNTLQRLNSDIEQSVVGSASSHDKDLLNLCHDCNRTANSLVNALTKLNAQGNSSLWSSFKVALKTVWTQDELDELQKRLDSFRQQISMHILVALR
jgi:hypothetical protein